VNCDAKDGFKLIPSLHSPNTSFEQQGSAHPCNRSQRLNSIDHQYLLAVDPAELRNLSSGSRDRSWSLDQHYVAFAKPSIEKTGQSNYLTAQAHRLDRDH
jgi:hypothetical protein